jgi:hypothetical protein
MTLILSLATPRYVQQVSDRLVNERGREFDPVSNKSLVYFARDALVVLGYSGLAYIDGVPTDQWMAQILTNEVFPGPGQRVGIRLGPRGQWLDLGQSAELLRQKCSEIYRRLRSPHRFLAPQIVMAGWQEGRRVWRPVLWIVEYCETKAAYVIDRTPRYGWWERGGRYLAVIPDHSSLRNEADLGALEQHSRISPEAAEKLLVSAVRSVAQRDTTVGPHCMSVFLPPPTANFVRTRYLPLTEGRAVLHNNQHHIEVPAGVSPWVIGPQVIAPPSVIVGSGHQISVGTFNVVTEAPDVPPGSGVIAASSSQRRPLWPP